MEDINIKYFNYASVDFLIDKNGVPVFMEVNDNTLAPYYIEQKNRITQRALKAHNEFINLNLGHRSAFLSCFDKHFKNDRKNFCNQEKNIAIICKRKDHPQAIEKEIRYLIELFRQNGYSAEMYTPDDFEVKQDCLFVKKDNTCPSLIFRRNFSFPPVGIKQPVINDLRVRKIAENKYKTHQMVDSLVAKEKLKIRQPKTYLIKDYSTLVYTIKNFFKDGFDCIAKPNCSYGGDGFFWFSHKDIAENNSKKIDAIAKRMEVGEEYLIQEMIESSLFRSAGNQEYYFDVRLMIYGGRFAGIEGRRSNCPFNENRISEKSLVTNIKGGGIDLLVVSTQDETNYHYEARNLGSPDRFDSVDFEVDSNYLVLGRKLFFEVKQAAETIIKMIDETLYRGE